MKKLLILLTSIMVLAITTSSCQVDASTVDASKFKNDVTYFQCQKTGEVFSIIGIEKAASFEQAGVGMAHIDRTDVTNSIKKQIKNFKSFSNWN